MVSARSSIFVLFLSACSDNPTKSDTEHLDAVGLRITSSGMTVVSYIRDGALQGSGYIEVEENSETAGLDIEFYNDENESWVTPDEEDYQLEIAISDTNTATFWQHEGEEGGFEFHISGKSVGITQAVFKILHDGHTDFSSREIEIRVVAGN